MPGLELSAICSRTLYPTTFLTSSIVDPYFFLIFAIENVCEQRISRNWMKMNTVLDWGIQRKKLKGRNAKMSITETSTSYEAVSEKTCGEIEGIFFDHLSRLMEKPDAHSDVRLLINKTFYGKIRDAFRSTLACINFLPGIVPICSCCKKVKNAEGEWLQLEKYFYENTSVLFSHGYCNQCADEILMGK